jgi:hypothetical protein
MDVKHIIARTNQLSSKEKVHILKILRENAVDFTKNENGFFFNLSNLEESVANQISECVDLIIKNRECIQNMNEKREQMLVEYKSMFEEKLRLSQDQKQIKYINSIILRDFSNIVLRVTPAQHHKIRMFPHLDDPDDIIKAYTQVLKNSLKVGVYKRIHETMKKSRSSSTTKATKYIHDDVFDAPQGEAEDDLIEFEGDAESIPESIPEAADDVEEVEEDTLHDVEDLDTEQEDNTSIDSDECEDENDLDYREKIDQKMQYFKLLLNKKGFQFNDSCVLRHEDYIV